MTLPVEEQAQAQAVRRLLRAVGGLEPAAEITGKSTGHLSRCQGVHYPDSLTVRDVELLEGVTHGTPGHPAVSRHLARQQNFVLVPLPGDLPGEGEWNRHIAALSSEAGALISGIATDLADDQDVSPIEATNRLPNARRLVEIAVELEQALAHKAREGS